MEQEVLLQRKTTGDSGTFGEILLSGNKYYSGELSWRDNQAGISCIPAGTYRCTYRFSQAHGLCYHVEDVPGRTDVEIHSANWMGDVSKGLRSQLKGCLALGTQVGELAGQWAVIDSKTAVNSFEEVLKCEPFTLTIKDIEA